MRKQHGSFILAACGILLFCNAIANAEDEKPIIPVEVKLDRLVDFDDSTLDALDRFSVEVAATAKKPMQAGDTLDGLGGFCTYGECENRREMIRGGFLPVGLAEGLKLRSNVSKDQAIKWDDVIFDPNSPIMTAYQSIS